MKLRISLLIVAATFMFNVYGQETKKDSEGLLSESEKLKASHTDTSKIHWRKGGTINVNGQQISLTNWAAGGQSAISANAMLSLFSTYTKGKSVWSNNLDLAYGVIKQASNRKWWKNDDRIQFTSKYGYKAFDHVYYAALLDFKSQFAAGYNYPNDSVRISNFLAPAYLVAALGFDWRPTKNLSIFLAPITGRFTFVNDDTLAKYGAFGVQKEVRDPTTGQVTTPYSKIRAQFGGYFKLVYCREIMENITFGTTLELFSDYLHNPQNLYVNWTTLTTFKVNKYISATLSTQLIYDEAVMIKDSDGKVGPRVQFKEVLGIGFAHKF